MKRLLIAAGVLLLCIGVLLVLSMVRQGNDRRALAAYKAQLRAQGEWLTLGDAGYPFRLETNADLRAFTNLARQLSVSSTLPAELDHLPFAEPGRMRVIWREEAPAGVLGNNPRLSPPTWEQLAADCERAKPILVALRAELEHPPRRFEWDYTEPFPGPWLPFEEMRSAAEFLAADTLVALRADDLDRARADLHALTQMTQLVRDDRNLGTTRIHVAVAGLGLEVMAQALHHEGWDEAGLAALQRDWEAVNLLEALEQGLVGERMFGLRAFDWVRHPAPTNRFRALFSHPHAAANVGLKDRLLDRARSLYWRGHMDRDELFYMRQLQGTLDIVRDQQAQGIWVSIETQMQAHQRACDQVVASPPGPYQYLGLYQYLLSAVLLPNFDRAARTTVRRETQRRMTVMAIALRRFHLRHGHFPANLQMLVPEYLDEASVDPWSGAPLLYRLNDNGTITLYSVGEDGVDDGGDSTPTTAPSRIEFWTGRDVVWPGAYSATNNAQD